MIRVLILLKALGLVIPNRLRRIPGIFGGILDVAVREATARIRARPILCHTEPPARVQPSCPYRQRPDGELFAVVVEVAVAVATGAMALRRRWCACTMSPVCFRGPT